MYQMIGVFKGFLSAIHQTLTSQLLKGWILSQQQSTRSLHPIPWKAELSQQQSARSSHPIPWKAELSRQQSTWPLPPVPWKAELSQQQSIRLLHPNLWKAELSQQHSTWPLYPNPWKAELSQLYVEGISILRWQSVFIVRSVPSCFIYWNLCQFWQHRYQILIDSCFALN